MSLDSLVPRRIGSSVHRRAEASPDGAADAVVDDTTALPSGSMRLLEGAVAVAAIITALLIGIR